MTNPSLKSDKVVTRLIDELAGTEYGISVARTFPNSIFNNNGFLGLKPWGFSERPQFTANTLVKTNIPQVNLTLS